MPIIQQKKITTHCYYFPTKALKWIFKMIILKMKANNMVSSKNILIKSNTTINLG